MGSGLLKSSDPRHELFVNEPPAQRVPRRGLRGATQIAEFEEEVWAKRFGADVGSASGSGSKYTVDDDEEGTHWRSSYSDPDQNPDHASKQMRENRERFAAVKKMVEQLQNTDWICEHYQVNNPHVHGAFSSISVATSYQTGAKRLVKHFDAGRRSKSEMKEEASVLLVLDGHPNIIRMFELFSDCTSCSLILELCEGERLIDEIRDNGVFNEQDASIIMQQLFRTVQFMHLRQVAHRDIRPENLIKKTRGFLKSTPIKFIDYGSAAIFRRGEFFKKRDVKGTPYYSAPQIGTGEYSQACDIWSVGMVLQAILLGVPTTDPPESYLHMRVRVSSKNWSKCAEGAQDLLGRLLHERELRRLSMQQALDHVWILRHAVQPTHVIAESSRTLITSKIAAVEGEDLFGSTDLASSDPFRGGRPIAALSVRQTA